MSKTEVGTNIEKPFVGYLLNVELSDENKQKVAAVQQKLVSKFGSDVWCAPPHSLHITLFDWLAPLVEYHKDKDELYEDIFDEYDKVVAGSLHNVGPIQVRFDEIKAFSAAIVVLGKDDGQFTKIRQHFLDNVELLPNTKRPPEIIHSSICRFTSELELEPIQEFVASLDFSMQQTINSFRLVREAVDPMIEFKQLKEYSLSS